MWCRKIALLLKLFFSKCGNASTWRLPPKKAPTSTSSLKNSWNWKHHAFWASNPSKTTIRRKAKRKENALWCKALKRKKKNDDLYPKKHRFSFWLHCIKTWRCGKRNLRTFFALCPPNQIRRKYPVYSLMLSKELSLNVMVLIIEMNDLLVFVEFSFCPI